MVATYMAMDYSPSIYTDSTRHSRRQPPSCLAVPDGHS